MKWAAQTSMQMRMETEMGTVEVHMYKGGTSKQVVKRQETYTDNHSICKKSQKKTGRKTGREGGTDNQRQPTTLAEKRKERGLEWKKTAI